MSDENTPPPLFSLVGERGQQGDVGHEGQPGREGHEGQPGREGHEGIPGRRGSRGMQGMRGQPFPIPVKDPWAERLKYIAVVAGVIVVIVSLYVTVNSQRNENKVLESNAVLRNRVTQVIDSNLLLERQLDTLIQDRENFQLDIECRDKYTDDVLVNGVSAVAAIADALGGAGRVEIPPLTPEEEQALLDGLIETMNKSVQPAKDSVAALEQFAALDPPPDECPYP